VFHFPFLPLQQWISYEQLQSDEDMATVQAYLSMLRVEIALEEVLRDPHSLDLSRELAVQVVSLAFN
jgi:hypothetical protein